MEGDYRYPSAATESLRGIAYCRLDNVELTVDLDPYRLKASLCGVMSALSRESGYRAADYIRKL